MGIIGKNLENASAKQHNGKILEHNRQRPRESHRKRCMGLWDLLSFQTAFLVWLNLRWLSPSKNGNKYCVLPSKKQGLFKGM